MLVQASVGLYLCRTVYFLKTSHISLALYLLLCRRCKPVVNILVVAISLKPQVYRGSIFSWAGPQVSAG